VYQHDGEQPPEFMPRIGRKPIMAQAHDMEAAKATYAGFISVIKIATPVIVVLVALVMFLLTR
jgi:hypothetical protein